MDAHVSLDAMLHSTLSMKSGLSSRAERTLEEFLPAVAAAAPPAQYDSTTAVDLSNAQNEVLRPELLEFFKGIVKDQVTSEVFASPTVNGGDGQLRDALAAFFNHYFHPVHAVKPEHIVLTAGATDAIDRVVHAVCDDGDSILVPGPSWHGFSHILKGRANVNIVVAQPPAYDNWENYLTASLQTVYDFSAEKSRIKAVLLSNPHNPLSRCYPKKALLQVMEFCQENGLHLIVDEALALTDLTTQPAKAPPFVSALSLAEPLVRSGALKVDPTRIHTVWSASNLFGMSGFRIGCILTQQNTPLISSLSLPHSKNTQSTLSTTFLTSLLTSPHLPHLLTLSSSRLTSSYTLLATALASWNIDFMPPSHGLFVFARLGAGARSADEEKVFFGRLAVAGVRVGEGRFFRGVEGEFGWARVRFACEVRVMRGVIARIAGVLGRE